MKTYEKKISSYKTLVQETDMPNDGMYRTVQMCQKIVQSQSASRASYLEFLYEQAGFIRKRWWALQGLVLCCLWFWMERYAQDAKDMMRIMGIVATAFVILIIPELWKNKRNRAVEIEQSCVYTLRQIASARMLLFGVVDLCIVGIFLTVTYHTVAISLYDLLLDFLLPVNVSCGICFRLLYSRWGEAEYIAVLCSLLWIGLWLGIVMNDVVYEKIVLPAGAGLILFSFVYVGFCVKKSLQFDEKSLEGYADGIGM